ncbi:hypothetical protein LCGC14_0744640 [marine sediment metagenome]|uniref:Uncharacterized protein n=1 Tax=marine sediment metagenome TaxID=412755 RepID=A0A0F9QQS1_9ZZZZ|nr:hypothetical protein [bacterium]
MNSITDFIEKYHLDTFEEVLELKYIDKINFLNDLNILLNTICRIFDKITTIFSLRGGQVLMSLAKLKNSEEIISKTDVQNCLNLDRREKLIHAFDFLLEHNYIEIKKKTSKFHVVKLNENDNPDFKLFREIVQKFWISPEEEKNKTKKWGDENK